jgi:hypothetical protein
MIKVGCKILMANGILFIILGLYAVFFNNTPLFSIINWLMDPGFFGNEKLSNGIVNLKTFTWIFLGMLHIIWGVNLLFTVRYGLMKKEAWAWRCIFVSVVSWLLIVAYYTIVAHQNNFILVTFVLAILFIVPLIMTREVLETGAKI